MRAEAWRALELPDDWCMHEAAYWSTFHVGLPAPDVPLLLHAALGREGASVREDWMRVFAHLGLVWGDRTLPPDHIAAACEALASAILNADDVLVRELCQRYLLPWCDAARLRLAGRSDGLDRIAACFEADLTWISEVARRESPGETRQNA